MGRAKYDEHRETLEQVEREFGVQPRFIVALWGIETNFGSFTGGFPVVNALATLAYDGRRSDYFRGELMNALLILEQGHIAPEAMKGSWAGAMGQSQFMPSSFLAYAHDHNGDGAKDIWNTQADVFASAANYLKGVGWNDDLTWGRRCACRTTLMQPWQLWMLSNPSVTGRRSACAVPMGQTCQRATFPPRLSCQAEGASCLYGLRQLPGRRCAGIGQIILQQPWAFSPTESPIGRLEISYDHRIFRDAPRRSAHALTLEFGARIVWRSRVDRLCRDRVSGSPAKQFSGGDTISTGDSRYKVGSPYQIKGSGTIRPSFEYSETGIASWYGPGFHGKDTANGETYDQNDLSGRASHASHAQRRPGDESRKRSVDCAADQ